MSTANVLPVPVEHTDPVNEQVLRVSEDRIQGFVKDPMLEISRLSGVPVETVIERIRAMLKGGTIRRVRQTLMATNLAPGALVAWKVAAKDLDSAFDFMLKDDPFSGHVVVRSTDQESAGSAYRLWTTLKVPQGFSMDKHCRHLMLRTGATDFKLMPAKSVFALGVGHTRRKHMEPGEKADVSAEPMTVRVAELSADDWLVLTALKREFLPEEITLNLWEARAAEIGWTLENFCRVAEDLVRRGVMGRFSTFLEHVKPLASGERVTKFNALFHWAVPVGREIEAGREVGRHYIMTHAYWREGGPEFMNVNVMGVAHGTDKDRVRAHKAAIDAHLEASGIPVGYTNIFWGGRSEIKPSEIAPAAYGEWCLKQGLDPQAMRA